MKITGLVWVLAIVVSVMVAGFSGTAAQAGGKSGSRSVVANKDRLAALRAKGAGAPVVMYPVYAMRDVHANIGDTVGLILEKGGMREISPCSLVFVREQEAEWEAVVSAFGRSVAAHSPAAEYALYAEIDGSPQNGTKEIRTVVVDRAGQVVWADRAAKGSGAFMKYNPANPMGCAQLIAGEFLDELGVSSSTAPRNGTMQRHWQASSGMPSDTERNQMQTRLAECKTKGAARKFVVYPAQVWREASAESMSHLCELFEENKLGKASPAKHAPVFAISGNSNEQKRLWDLARAFKKYIRNHTPDADYALLPEYTMAKDGVHTVHFILVDSRGEWVVVDFQNDHHADFNKIAPKTVADGDQLVIKRLASYLR